MFHLTSWPGGPFSYVLHNRDFQVFHAPRGRATRRAAPRRAGPPAIRFFILILFSLSLSLSFRLSLTSLPLAFLPLFRRCFSLSSFLSFLYSLVLFSLHSYRPTTLQSACANWASREGETITRGGKKKEISISRIFDPIDALWR